MNPITKVLDPFTSPIALKNNFTLGLALVTGPAYSSKLRYGYYFQLITSSGPATWYLLASALFAPVMQHTGERTGGMNMIPARCREESSKMLRYEYERAPPSPRGMNVTQPNFTRMRALCAESNMRMWTCLAFLR